VLNTADVCVNPDEYNVMNDRSTMNKVLEYMALGKPIVQFDLTEGRVSAAESSLYAKRNDPVDFASRILELLADPARREAMGRIGRERVEQQFSWERQAPRLLEAYSSLWSETRSAQRETDGEWVR
jgi:glycosyltransferase involved in cell wall biosynthesis